MTNIARIILPLGLAAATAASGEILTQSGETLMRTGPFELECWQEGKRVIHQPGLQAMTLGQALEGHTLSFRGDGEKAASVVLIPFEHSLCITRSE